MKKYLFLLVALASVFGCQKSISDANALLAQENFLSARQIYSNILQQNPQDPVALYGLAMTHCSEALYRGTLGFGMASDWYPAIYYMSIALKKKPQQPEYNRALAIFQFNLGCAFKNEGARDKAIARLESAVGYDSTLSKAYNILGSLYQEIGDLHNAERCYLKVLQFQPDYAPAHFNIGVLAWNAGNFVAAESSFAKALSISPENTYFAQWAHKAAQKVKDHQ